MPRPEGFSENLDRPDPFFESELPSRVTRGFANLLIALVVGGLLAAAFVRLPQSVKGSFELVPLRGADPVRALRDGRLTAVHVADGDQVAEGAPIAAIRSQDINELRAELEIQRALRSGVEESLANERDRDRSRRGSSREERRRLERQIADLDDELELRNRERVLTEELLGRFRELHDRDLLSRTDLVQYELKATRAAIEVEHLESERGALLAAVEKLAHEQAMGDAEHEEAVHQLEEKAATAAIRIETLLVELEQSEGGELIVSAPCAGTVLRLHLQAGGSVVQAGEAIAEIACAGEPLVAELHVDPVDVGRLESGQSVKLLYDAFPYQRHGVRYGEVQWISPAAVSASGERLFRARVALGEEAIEVAGRPRSLLAGMGGDARVLIERRTILSAAFEPLARLRESVTHEPRI